MKTQIKPYLFYISAFLVLISTLLLITKWFYAPYLFAIGSSGIAIYYLTTPYTGNNFRIKRLRRFEIIAAVLLITTSYLIFKNKHGNDWIISLSISSFLILYTNIITGIEEKKEKQ